MSSSSSSSVAIGIRAALLKECLCPDTGVSAKDARSPAQHRGTRARATARVI